MVYYETETMDWEEMVKFRTWFDENIGTDREVNEVITGKYVILCCELEGDEANMCKRFEQSSLSI